MISVLHFLQILKQLTGKTVLWEQAQSILDARFSKSKKNTKPIVMLVDEVKDTSRRLFSDAFIVIFVAGYSMH